MFQGSMPVLVTPFKNGALDVDALKSLGELLEVIYCPCIGRGRFQQKILGLANC